MELQTVGVSQLPAFPARMSFGTARSSQDARVWRGEANPDGGDHSGSWDTRESGPGGFSPVSLWQGSREHPAHLPARAVGARHPVALLSRP